MIIRTTIKTPIEVEIIPLEIINRKSATSKNAAICLMLIIMRKQPNAAITNLNLTIVSSVICFYLNPPLIWKPFCELAPIELLTRLIIPPTENMIVTPIIPQSICCFPCFAISATLQINHELEQTPDKKQHRCSE